MKIVKVLIISQILSNHRFHPFKIQGVSHTEIWNQIFVANFGINNILTELSEIV